MSYFILHWHGKLSLSISFWINFIGLTIFISYAELYILSKLAYDTSNLLFFTLISLFVTRIIFFPWQLIGYFRAIEKDFITQKNLLKTWGLQGLAILMIVFTLAYSLQVIQNTSNYLNQIEIYNRPIDPVQYKLTLTNKNQLKISGHFEIGITNAVKEFLDENPSIESVILNSLGGQIYEGRGLSKVFTNLRLDTYVYDECSSACATAFIGGVKRNLGTSGKLGFHQYKVNTTEHSKFVPFYDLRIEQERDLELFKSRGVTNKFLNKMFDQPANKIWFPNQQTLLESNIIHTSMQN